MSSSYSIWLALLCTMCFTLNKKQTKKNLHLPCRRSGLTTPSSMSVAVTMEHVMGSSSSRLISAKESDIPSFPITTCFVLFSCTHDRRSKVVTWLCQWGCVALSCPSFIAISLPLLHQLVFFFSFLQHMLNWAISLRVLHRQVALVVVPLQPCSTNCSMLFLFNIRTEVKWDSL